jgi:TolB protein
MRTARTVGILALLHLPSSGTGGAAAVEAVQATGSAVSLLSGTRIAFISDRAGNTELYTMNHLGALLQRHSTNGAAESDPAWSPRESRIAYASNAGGNTDLYLIDLRTGSPAVALTDAPGADRNPSWSPDGARIAFESERAGNREIYAMNANGSGLVRLTDNPAEDMDPDWSPDGQRIVFASTRDGATEIYSMRVDGTGQTRLTNSPGFDNFPAVSPDGQRIAFASQRAPHFGRYQIYVMDADGSNTVRLTTNTASDRSPSWSPDGQHLVLESNRDGDFEIYRMEAGGANAMALTASPGYDVWADWGEPGRVDMAVANVTPAGAPAMTGDVVALRFTVRNDGPQNAFGWRLVLGNSGGILPRPDQSSQGCTAVGGQGVSIACDLPAPVPPGAELSVLVALEVPRDRVGHSLYAAKAVPTAGSSQDLNAVNNEARGSLEVIARVQMPSGIGVRFQLSQGQGTVSIAPVLVPDPATDDGQANIRFLDKAMDINLAGGAACSDAAPCTIFFEFTDGHLLEAYWPPPYNFATGSVISGMIAYDIDENGSFAPLPATFVDGSPSPYVLSATLRSTSFIGVGWPSPRVEALHAELTRLVRDPAGTRARRELLESAGGKLDAARRHLAERSPRRASAIKGILDAVTILDAGVRKRQLDGPAGSRLMERLARSARELVAAELIEAKARSVPRPALAAAEGFLRQGDAAAGNVAYGEATKAYRNAVLEVKRK